MSADEWAVVGCTHCDGHWLLAPDQRGEQATSTCRLCGAEHATEKLHALAESPTQVGAAERRARILAERQDEAAAYARETGYAEQEERVVERAPLYSDAFGEAAADAVKKFADAVGVSEEQHEPLGLPDHIEASLSERAEAALGFYDDAYADALEDEWPDDKYAGRFEAEARESIEQWQEDCKFDVVDDRVGELALADEFPADAGVVARLDADTTVTRSECGDGLWATLVEQQPFVDAVVAGVRSLAEDRDPHELWGALEHVGVAESARGPMLALGTAESDAEREHALEGSDSDEEGGVIGLVDVLHRLGTGRAEMEGILGVARLVGRGADEAPTIALGLRTAFRDQAADQRDAVVRLAWALARHCEVVVAGRPIDLRAIEAAHDDVAEFSDRRTGQGQTTPDAEQRERALDAYRDQERPAAILRTIYEAPETRVSYNQLTSTLRCSTATISQWVQGRDDALAEFGLVEQGRIDGRSYVSLTPTGRAVIEALDDETTGQQRLDAIFCESSHRPDHGREDTREHVGGGQGDPRRKGSGLAPVGELPRHRAAGAVAASEPGGVSTVDYQHPETEDYRSADLWVDEARSRLVVSSEYVNPMQYWVATARAFTQHRVFEWALTPERLESGEHDFATLFEEHRQALRSTRCLGHLPDDIESAAEYVEALQEWRESLTRLTSDLVNGNYDDELRMRSEITQDAHGLCGTIAHLCDMVGVDVVREVRLPTFSRNADEGFMREVSKSIAIGAAIQSCYSQCTVYRQLFETRESKLHWSIEPDVDAADPTGGLIGSVVVTGDFGDTEGAKTQRFVDELEQWLAEPAEVREDAPEFVVDVPLRTFDIGREHVSTAAAILCDDKNLRPTREAVSLLCLFVGDPYDAARALYGLSKEEAAPRDLRVSEVSEAIARLDAERLLPQGSPAERRIVRALVAAERHLSTSELEEYADVSRTSLTGGGEDASPRAGERLEALGLVERTEDGQWRLALPFNDDAERYEDRLPSCVAKGDEDLFVRDVVLDVVEMLYPPWHPIHGCWASYRADGLPDLASVLDHAGWMERWIEPLEAVCDARSVFSLDAEPRRRTVSFGPRAQGEHVQTSMQEVATRGD